MKLCRVVGAVWGAKEAGSLGGRKLLAVRPVAVASGHSPADISADGERADLQDGIIVALDQLGAGIGEYVLVAHGSRVRDLTLGPGVPTKDVVVAIVDSANIDLDLLAEGGAS
jgi:microcompartment protein CcmK/EutM